MLRPDSTRKSAFTLVELLVVITIIAIIAALLLTALARSKARALQIQCAGNLRQLGIAVQEFKTDHHYYPPELDPSIHSEGRNWMSALNDQMGEKNDFPTYQMTGVWRCPAAYRPENFNEHQSQSYYFYGYNSYGLGGFNRTNLSLGLSEHWGLGPAPKLEELPTKRVGESQIANPSEMIAMGDDFCGSSTFIVDGDLSFGRITDQQMYSWVPAASAFFAESTARARHRHQGKANIVYCDGHVDSPTLKFLFEDTSDEALSNWNRDHLPHREKL